MAQKQIDIVPIVAVDFSLSNLTFDERRCLHTTKEESQSEYRNLLQCVSKAFRNISPSSLFYGYGAKTICGQGEDGPCRTSDLFSGTCDLMNPLVMTDHLDQQYYKCLESVELNAPVHLSKIISKAIEFATGAEKSFWEDINDFENQNKKSALTYF